MSFFSKSKFLIFTFTGHLVYRRPVDYRSQESHCKGPFFTDVPSNQGVKHWLFYGKYCNEVVKLKCFCIKQKGSKILQKGHLRILECLNITNLVNTKVAKFIKYQSHEGSNHLLSAKSIKIEKERSDCHIKLFQLVQLVNFSIYMYY